MGQGGLVERVFPGRRQRRVEGKSLPHRQLRPWLGRGAEEEPVEGQAEETVGMGASRKSAPMEEGLVGTQSGVSKAAEGMISEPGVAEEEKTRKASLRHSRRARGWIGEFRGYRDCEYRGNVI